MSATNNKEDIKQSISSQSNDIISTSSTTASVTPIVTTQVSITAPSNQIQSTNTMSELLSQPQLPPTNPFAPRNGSNTSTSRRGLVHSVSIIVEPAIADNDGEDAFADQLPTPSVSTERRNTIAGPIVLLEDFGFEPPRKAREENDIVHTLLAHARLRKEEFARLLEEHAQIVNEINRAETSLL